MSFKAGITSASLRSISHKLATKLHVSSFSEPKQVNLDSGVIVEESEKGSNLDSGVIVEESEKGSKGDALNLFMSLLKMTIRSRQTLNVLRLFLPRR